MILPCSVLHLSAVGRAFIRLFHKLVSMPVYNQGKRCVGSGRNAGNRRFWDF